eukprot:2786800-Rhodomonas_salina.1
MSWWWQQYSVEELLYYQSAVAPPRAHPTRHTPMMVCCDAPGPEPAPPLAAAAPAAPFSRRGGSV